MKQFKNYSKFYIKSLVVIGEIIILNTILGAMLYSYMGVRSVEECSEACRMLFTLLNLGYLLALSSIGIILEKRAVLIEKILERVLRTVLAILAIVFLGLYTINGKYFSLTFILALALTIFIAFTIWRISARLVLEKYRSHGGNSKNVIILGAGSVASEVYSDLICNIYHGYNFIGFFDDRAPEDYKVKPELVKGNLNDVINYLDNNAVDEIFCALPAGDDRKATPIIYKAETNMVRCYIVPDFKRFIKKKVELTFMEGIPIVSLRKEPLTKPLNQLIKRTFDIAFSALFLATIFPILFIVLGAIIKITSKGPIFFKQKRTGEYGKDFYCYKFRTMKQNNDSDTVQATKGDDRITKIGAFMRKTNLDEMPQFINVFLGDMSVVGPRPHMLKHTEMYSQLIDKYMIRHLARPGVTGLAQVTGYRGETKNLSDMEGRVKRDVWYIENWSVGLDIRIIFQTVYNMIKGDDNAY